MMHCRAACDSSIEMAITRSTTSGARSTVERLINDRMYTLLGSGVLLVALNILQSFYYTCSSILLMIVGDTAICDKCILKGSKLEWWKDFCLVPMGLHRRWISRYLILLVNGPLDQPQLVIVSQIRNSNISEKKGDKLLLLTSKSV